MKVQELMDAHPTRTDTKRLIRFNQQSLRARQDLAYANYLIGFWHEQWKEEYVKRIRYKDGRI